MISISGEGVVCKYTLSKCQLAGFIRNLIMLTLGNGLSSKAVQSLAYPVPGKAVAGWHVGSIAIAQVPRLPTHFAYSRITHGV